MYTNGYTGQPYLTIIAIRSFDGRTSHGCLTDTEFAAESEHVVLATAPDSDDAERQYWADEREFNGF